MGSRQKEDMLDAMGWALRWEACPDERTKCRRQMQMRLEFDNSRAVAGGIWAARLTTLRAAIPGLQHLRIMDALVSNQARFNELKQEEIVKRNYAAAAITAEQDAECEYYALWAFIDERAKAYAYPAQDASEVFKQRPNETMMQYIDRAKEYHDSTSSMEARTELQARNMTIEGISDVHLRGYIGNTRVNIRSWDELAAAAAAAEAYFRQSGVPRLTYTPSASSSGAQPAVSSSSAVSAQEAAAVEQMASHLASKGVDYNTIQTMKRVWWKGVDARPNLNYDAPCPYHDDHTISKCAILNLKAVGVDPQPRQQNRRDDGRRFDDRRNDRRREERRYDDQRPRAYTVSNEAGKQQPDYQLRALTSSMEQMALNQQRWMERMERQERQLQLLNSQPQPVAMIAGGGVEGMQQGRFQQQVPQQEPALYQKDSRDYRDARGQGMGQRRPDFGQSRRSPVGLCSSCGFIHPFPTPDQAKCYTLNPWLALRQPLVPDDLDRAVAVERAYATKGLKHQELSDRIAQLKEARRIREQSASSSGGSGMGPSRPRVHWAQATYHAVPPPTSMGTGTSYAGSMTYDSSQPGPMSFTAVVSGLEVEPAASSAVVAGAGGSAPAESRSGSRGQAVALLSNEVLSLLSDDDDNQIPGLMADPDGGSIDGAVIDLVSDSSEDGDQIPGLMADPAGCSSDGAVIDLVSDSSDDDDQVPEPLTDPDTYSIDGAVADYVSELSDDDDDDDPPGLSENDDELPSLAAMETDDSRDEQMASEDSDDYEDLPPLESNSDDGWPESDEDSSGPGGSSPDFPVCFMASTSSTSSYAPPVLGEWTRFVNRMMGSPPPPLCDCSEHPAADAMQAEPARLSSPEVFRCLVTAEDRPSYSLGCHLCVGTQQWRLFWAAYNTTAAAVDAVISEARAEVSLIDAQWQQAQAHNAQLHEDLKYANGHRDFQAVIRLEVQIWDHSAVLEDLQHASDDAKRYLRPLEELQRYCAAIDQWRMNSGDPVYSAAGSNRAGVASPVHPLVAMVAARRSATRRATNAAANTEPERHYSQREEQLYSFQPATGVTPATRRAADDYAAKAGQVAHFITDTRGIVQQSWVESLLRIGALTYSQVRLMQRLTELTLTGESPNRPPTPEVLSDATVAARPTAFMAVVSNSDVTQEPAPPTALGSWSRLEEMSEAPPVPFCRCPHHPSMVEHTEEGMDMYCCAVALADRPLYRHGCNLRICKAAWSYTWLAYQLTNDQVQEAIGVGQQELDSVLVWQLEIGERIKRQSRVLDQPDQTAEVSQEATQQRQQCVATMGRLNRLEREARVQLLSLSQLGSCCRALDRWRAEGGADVSNAPPAAVMTDASTHLISEQDMWAMMAEAARPSGGYAAMAQQLTHFITDAEGRVQLSFVESLLRIGALTFDQQKVMQKVAELTGAVNGGASSSSSGDTTANLAAAPPTCLMAQGDWDYLARDGQGSAFEADHDDNPFAPAPTCNCPGKPHAVYKTGELTSAGPGYFRCAATAVNQSEGCQFSISAEYWEQLWKVRHIDPASFGSHERQFELERLTLLETEERAHRLCEMVMRDPAISSEDKRRFMECHVLGTRARREEMEECAVKRLALDRNLGMMAKLIDYEDSADVRPLLAPEDWLHPPPLEQCASTAATSPDATASYDVRPVQDGYHHQAKLLNRFIAKSRVHLQQDWLEALLRTGAVTFDVQKLVDSVIQVAPEAAAVTRPSASQSRGRCLVARLSRAGYDWAQQDFAAEAATRRPRTMQQEVADSMAAIRAYGAAEAAESAGVAVHLPASGNSQPFSAERAAGWVSSGDAEQADPVGNVEPVVTAASTTDAVESSFAVSRELPAFSQRRPGVLTAGQVSPADVAHYSAMARNRALAAAAANPVGPTDVSSLPSGSQPRQQRSDPPAANVAGSAGVGLAPLSAEDLLGMFMGNLPEGWELHAPGSDGYTAITAENAADWVNSSTTRLALDIARAELAAEESEAAQGSSSAAVTNTAAGAATSAQDAPAESAAAATDDSATGAAPEPPAAMSVSTLPPLPANYRSASCSTGLWYFPPKGPGSLTFVGTQRNYQPSAALFDTGANANIMSKAVADAMGVRMTASCHADVQGLGAKTKILGVTEPFEVTLDLGQYQSRTHKLVFLVLEQCSADVLIGTTAMSTFLIMPNPCDSTCAVPRMHEDEPAWVTFPMVRGAAMNLAANLMRPAPSAVAMDPPTHMFDIPRCLMATVDMTEQQNPSSASEEPGALIADGPDAAGVDDHEAPAADSPVAPTADQPGDVAADVPEAPVSDRVDAAAADAPGASAADAAGVLAVNAAGAKVVALPPGQDDVDDLLSYEGDEDDALSGTQVQQAAGDEMTGPQQQALGQQEEAAAGEQQQQEQQQQLSQELGTRLDARSMIDHMRLRRAVAAQLEQAEAGPLPTVQDVQGWEASLLQQQQKQQTLEASLAAESAARAKTFLSGVCLSASVPELTGQGLVRPLLYDTDVAGLINQLQDTTGAEVDVVLAKWKEGLVGEVLEFHHLLPADKKTQHYLLYQPSDQLHLGGIKGQYLVWGGAVDRYEPTVLWARKLLDKSAKLQGLTQPQLHSQLTVAVKQQSLNVGEPWYILKASSAADLNLEALHAVEQVRSEPLRAYVQTQLKATATAVCDYLTEGRSAADEYSTETDSAAVQELRQAVFRYADREVLNSKNPQAMLYTNLLDRALWRRRLCMPACYVPGGSKPCAAFVIYVLNGGMAVTKNGSEPPAMLHKLSLYASEMLSQGKTEYFNADSCRVQALFRGACDRQYSNTVQLIDRVSKHDVTIQKLEADLALSVALTQSMAKVRACGAKAVQLEEELKQKKQDQGHKRGRVQGDTRAGQQQFQRQQQLQPYKQARTAYGSAGRYNGGSERQRQYRPRQPWDDDYGDDEGFDYRPSTNQRNQEPREYGFGDYHRDGQRSYDHRYGRSGPRHNQRLPEPPQRRNDNRRKVGQSPLVYVLLLLLGLCVTFTSVVCAAPGELFANATVMLDGMSPACASISPEFSRTPLVVATSNSTLSPYGWDVLQWPVSPDSPLQDYSCRFPFDARFCDTGGSPHAPLTSGGTEGLMLQGSWKEALQMLSCLVLTGIMWAWRLGFVRDQHTNTLRMMVHLMSSMLTFGLVDVLWKCILYTSSKLCSHTFVHTKWRKRLNRLFKLECRSKTTCHLRSLKSSTSKHMVSCRVGRWEQEESKQHYTSVMLLQPMLWLIWCGMGAAAVIGGFMMAQLLAATAATTSAASMMQVEAMAATACTPVVMMGRIETTLPDGVQSVPSHQLFTKDPEHGWTYGNHPELTADEQSQLAKMLVSKRSCFADDMVDLPGYCGDEGPCTLPLTTDKPIYTPPRRLSPLEKEVVDKKCTELKDAGVIKPCPTNKYAAPVVIAAKKDLEGRLVDHRMCTDQRNLNTATELDRYGMHLPEEIFQSVHGSRFFTKIDLRAGFLQIPIAEEDQPKTAFWWNGKLWMYTRMVFGLKNSPAKFQRVMDYEISKANLDHCCRSFIDDLLIHSKTAAEHIDHVAKVLDMLYSCGLRAHPGKSIFAAETIEYLGHNISPYGSTPHETKIAAIKETPNPTNIEGLRSMLGFFNYYRCYVPHFSEIAKPLNALLSKNQPWQWGPEQQAAKDKIVEELCTEGRALKRLDPDPSKPIFLHTDWSKRGISAILGQKDSDGQEYMCVCLSRSLNKAEQNYCSYEGEMLAVVWGIKSLRCYLHGRPFTLVTDHQPLTWLMTNQSLTGKHARWALSIMDYEFDILHRPGKTHQNADFLSRYPQQSTEDCTGARLDEDTDVRKPPPQVIGIVDPEYESPASFFAQLGSNYTWLKHRSMTTDVPTCLSATLSSFIPTPDDLVAGNNGYLDDEQWLQAPEDAATAQLHTNTLKRRATEWVQATFPFSRQPNSYGPRQVTGEKDDMGVRTTVTVQSAPIGQVFFPAVKEQGLVLVELFGGLAAGLEMALRNGIRVHKYIYCDTSPTAQTIARHRVAELHARYPYSFPFSASTDMFSHLPQDVRNITSRDLMALHTKFPTHPWLVVAGWECQDLSSAGKCRGLEGSRSNSFFPLIQILGALQQIRDPTLTGYLVENTAFQYNFNSPAIAYYDYHYVLTKLGRPVSFDAAKVGSHAHRVRNYWTNLVNDSYLIAVLAMVPVPDSTVADILDTHHAIPPAQRTDGRPFYLLNYKGQPLRALPTLVAYVGSRAFRPGKQGAVWNLLTQEWEEPNPNERERALGYLTGTTAAPGISEKQRHEATGNCMDANAMQVLLAIADAVSHHLNNTHQPFIYTNEEYTVFEPWAIDYYESNHPKGLQIMTRCGWDPGHGVGKCRQGITAHIDVGRVPNQTLQELDCHHGIGYQAPCAAVIAMLGGVTIEDSQDNLQHDNHTSSASPRQAAKEECDPVKIFQQTVHDLQMAQQADKESESMLDIWRDGQALLILAGDERLKDLTSDERRNAAKRARKYSMMQGVVMRRMADGSLRKVPRPEERDDIVKTIHDYTGHFGRARTLSLVAAAYWWNRMDKDVARIVGCCAACDQINAVFTVKQPVLNPLEIKGLFYRWGVDLMGPFEETAEGNKYVMVAVEHFSKHIELVAIPAKEPRYTSSAFLHNVLCKFGACAEVVTDRGGEWEGVFQQLLEQALIDHRRTSPDHPQADGLAERCVQTVKRALRKHCQVTKETNDWDSAIAWIALGYRCSVQSATKYSPYQLLYGVPPTIPPAVKEKMIEPIDFDHPEQAADALLNRAAIMKRNVATAGDNLKIAQHRDTLRYAATRSGAYQPKLRRFYPGDYVYLRRPVSDSTLQAKAKPSIFRIVEVKTTGVVKVQGRCGKTRNVQMDQLAPCHLPIQEPEADLELAVPAELACEACNFPDDEGLMLLCDRCETGWHTYCLTPPLNAVPKGAWVCPRCESLGLKPLPAKTKKLTGPAGPDEPKFVTAAVKARDARAESYGGRYVVKRFQDPVTKRPRPYWGKVEFRGAKQRPVYFSIVYEDGDSEHMTLQGLLKYVMPVGTQLPKGVTIPVGEGAVANAVTAMTAVAPESKVELPSTVSFDSYKQVSEFLSVLMPGDEPISKPHAGRIRIAALQLKEDNGLWGNPSAGELNALMRVLQTSAVQTCCDPLTKSTVVEEYLQKAGYSVYKVDRSLSLSDRMQPSFYQGLASKGAMDLVVTNPCPKLLDLALPMILRHATTGVCALVPGHYLTNVPEYRRRWLSGLVKAGVVQLVLGVPKGVAALQAAWICVFTSKGTRQATVRQEFLGDSTCYYPADVEDPSKDTQN